MNLEMLKALGINPESLVAQKNETNFDLGKVEEHIRQLNVQGAALDAGRDYDVGDLVEWKPGLRNPTTNFPTYGEPCLCREVKPVQEDENDCRDGAPISYGDLVVGVIRAGVLLEFTMDSRRFRKYKPVPNS